MTRLFIVFKRIFLLNLLKETSFLKTTVMKHKKTLSEFKKKKILVIGDLILDRYIWGKVSRISPEAPVPIVEVTDEDFLLGGASNVANNIVALGGNATIVGVAGNDRGGDQESEVRGRLSFEPHQHSGGNGNAGTRDARCKGECLCNTHSNRVLVPD